MEETKDFMTIDEICKEIDFPNSQELFNALWMYGSKEALGFDQDRIPNTLSGWKEVACVLSSMLTLDYVKKDAEVKKGFLTENEIEEAAEAFKNSLAKFKRG